MDSKPGIILRVLSLFLAMAIVLPAAGCQRKYPGEMRKSAPVPPIKRLVVSGFKPLIPEGQEARVVRGPLTGSVYMAEPVSSDHAEMMTALLFDRLAGLDRFDMISPGQAEGVFLSLLDDKESLDKGPLEILQELGKAFGADAVLTGYLYRWKQREGTDYGVTEPASVGFDLYLVRPSDGAVLWRGKFDKTQRSFTENLLDAKSHFKTGFRWIKAEELAERGLDMLLEDMPQGAGRAGS